MLSKRDNYVRLQELLDAARAWFPSPANEALGTLLLGAERVLFPWARAEAGERLKMKSEDVRDLVSEAGLKALVHFGDFKGATRREFCKWFKTIVEHLISDIDDARHPRSRRESSLERDAQTAELAELLEAKDPSPEAAAICAERAGWVRRVLRKLPKEQRDVVRAWMEGLSLAAIAEQFNRPKSYVRYHWEKAAEKLRAALGPVAQPA